MAHRFRGSHVARRSAPRLGGARLCLCFLILCALQVGCAGCGDDGGAATTPDVGMDARSTPDACVACPDAADVSVDTADPDPSCPDNTCVCRIGQAGGSCATEYCAVTVERGVLARERLFSVTADVRAGESGEELLGRRVCSWETDAVATDLSREYEVSLRFEEDEVPSGFDDAEVVGVIFDNDRGTLAGDAITDPARRRVALGVRTPTPLAATVLPAHFQADEELGLPNLDPIDDASYFRNISRFRFGAVHHDGQRFYAGNGRRLLIWESGVPSSPEQQPDIILGQPDLVNFVPGASAAVFHEAVAAIWSDADRLAVAEGNRVLVWQRVPQSSFEPADLVLGQPDFASTKPNADGPPGALTMSKPSGIASDGSRFAVADTNNHRVLLWNRFPSISAQPPDVVVGQPDFTTNLLNNGELPIYQSRGVYIDASRTAFTSTFACNCVQVIDGFPTTNNPARDYALGSVLGGNRVTPSDLSRAASITAFGSGGVAVHSASHVSIWRAFPTEDTALPDFTLGKPDGAHGDVLGRITLASFSTPATVGSLYADDQRVLVADGYRVLAWDALADVGYRAADRAIGHPSAASSIPNVDYSGIGPETLAFPAAISSAGDVTAVADRANNRVIVLRGGWQAPTITVLGHPGGSFYLAADPSETTLHGPSGVFTDGTRLAVADSENHRVLVWNTLPITNTPADIVLGQSDFVTGAQNGGAGDVDGDGDIDASATSLHYPGGVWFDADTLAVADTYNHRVLLWEGGLTSGAAATRVIGQAEFGANEPNGGLGWFVRDETSLARPTDVVGLDDGRLAVTDGENNRVLIFGVGTAAEVVIGQPDFVSDVSPNWLSGFNLGWPRADSTKDASEVSLRWPSGIAASGGRLAVSDTGNHRVVVYDAPFVSGMAATDVIGQPTPDARSRNGAGLSASGLSAPEDVTFVNADLAVADTGNHRLLQWNPAQPSAHAVHGQPGFGRNAINGSSPAFDTLKRPGGFAIDAGAIWVADRGHHRVVALENGKLSRVLGQIDRGGSLPNAGRDGAEMWTLAQPADVWTDGTRMVVADRDNHRVLIWNEMPETQGEPADVVLGQVDGQSNLPNRGAATEAAANAMLGPQGVHVEGDTLFVADTGNNRVLVFTTFPTTDGVAADHVLCQADFGPGSPNRGAETTADGCAGPTDVLVIDGTVYIADAGNNRVVAYPDGAAASATVVIGQPDFETRAPRDAEGMPSALHLNNPTRLAFDGSGLFVVDRANHRVVVYDFVPDASGVAADRVIGQSQFASAVVTDAFDAVEAPDGIFVLPQTYNRTTVWIADAGQNRLVRFSRVARRF